MRGFAPQSQTPTNADNLQPSPLASRSFYLRPPPRIYRVVTAPSIPLFVEIACSSLQRQKSVEVDFICALKNNRQKASFIHRSHVE
ncbi:hypothetical protein XENTR_v10009415 [Xenopus tropicalis]|nr:hypothetical protein XENTR_v10009415 [Xenopus tropicalis]